jgi:hypothetical protein
VESEFVRFFRKFRRFNVFITMNPGYASTLALVAFVAGWGIDASLGCYGW